MVRGNGVWGDRGRLGGRLRVAQVGRLRVPFGGGRSGPLGGGRGSPLDGRGLPFSGQGHPLTGRGYGRAGRDYGLGRRGYGLGGSSSFGPQRRSLLARLGARDSPLWRLDWILLSAVAGLTVIGTLLVWSATQAHQAQTGADPRAFLKKELLNVAIGLVLMGTVAMLDYRVLRAYAPVGYMLACVGLVAVLTPVGATINGAHSWIVIGAGFQVEPSEFAKVTLVLMLAVVLGELRDGENMPTGRDILSALALSAPALGMVLLEPDLGVAMVLVVMIFGMLAVSGARLRWLIGLALACAVVGATVLQLHLLKSYQIQRFTAFAHPSADPAGAGYNANQALIAIGSGGMFGQGLFHGTQTAGGFVPEQHTDFIFTVAGEELGFTGAIVIIGLLGVVLWRALRIAVHSGSQFGTLVAGGVTCWFAFQAFVNIGMTMGIMPITGLPLPFVSYGGSATFADMIAIGLLQAVHRRRAVFD